MDASTRSGRVVVGLSLDIHNLKIRFESAQMDSHIDP
jgi:hypothetical protein